jgi:hypothetical protein
MMHLTYAVPLVLGALLAAPAPALASQLRVDPHNPCVAHGNGSVFNITGLPWPFTFTDSNNYAYTLNSPCGPAANLTSCPGFPKTEVVLCQKDHWTPGEYYNCGTPASALWILPNAWGTQGWSILFQGGNNWRMTNVTFVADSSVPTPTAEFTGESPYLQYNVLIRGACVGQPFNCGTVPADYGHPDVVAARLAAAGVAAAA